MVNSGYLDIVLEILDIKCLDIFKDLLVTLGNILGCDDKDYIEEFEKRNFPQIFVKCLESKNEIILKDESIMTEVAWLLCNYCNKLRDVNNTVTLSFY